MGKRQPKHHRRFNRNPLKGKRMHIDLDVSDSAHGDVSDTADGTSESDGSISDVDTYNYSVHTIPNSARVKVSKDYYTTSQTDGLKVNFHKVPPPKLEGYRILNLDLLATHVNEITKHTIFCAAAVQCAKAGRSTISLVSEQHQGLATVLTAKCCGCGKLFHINSSPKIQSSSKRQHYDINVRAVWGTMATGGGAAHLNESMATMDIPGLSQSSFSTIEHEISNWWKAILDADMLEAGNLERRMAEERGDFHQGVPAISVVCDGGWSKRSHKHTYNAMGGVAIVIGAETGKLLYIGIRNRLCCICTRASGKQVEPVPHECFKNWNNSSQSMESDILAAAFMDAEKVHGVRYMRLIGDGDSSVFAKIQESVPVWGKYVTKLECANHACKCLRGSLEKLVVEKPKYKGKNKLTKPVRVRLTTAVRCAIRMRSKETNRPLAIRKLERDIRNSVFHIYGHHENCSSDFCHVSATSTPIGQTAASTSTTQATPYLSRAQLDSSTISQTAVNTITHTALPTSTQTAPSLFSTPIGINTCIQAATTTIVQSSPATTIAASTSSAHATTGWSNAQLDLPPISKTAIITSTHTAFATSTKPACTTNIQSAPATNTSSCIFSAQTTASASTPSCNTPATTCISGIHTTSSLQTTSTADSVHTTSCPSESIDDTSIPRIFEKQLSYWQDGTTEADMEESRKGGNLNPSDLDKDLIADVAVLLDRLASKADRLIGNNTTNLAESWMSVRCKFDGGKVFNRCNRGSWQARCYGGALRKNFGMKWSPNVWKKATHTEPGIAFTSLYERRLRHSAASYRSRAKPDVQARARKRKRSSHASGLTKKARQDYGEDVIDVVPDVSSQELDVTADNYLSANVTVTASQINDIECNTRSQSSCQLWKDERKKRLTASNFGEIVRKVPTRPVKRLVERLLYSTFRGNRFTRKGLQEESTTIDEYILRKKERGEHVKVEKVGLVVDAQHNFLAASTDGKVITSDGQVGLIEVKNVLQNSGLHLIKAATKSGFCLQNRGGSLQLKRSHSYFYQCQGQLNILGLPWLDFVVRRTNPYEIHIERIYRDKDLWSEEMVPKLKAFYNKAILPELAVPRFGKSPGIREPGKWFDAKKPATSRKRLNRREAETDVAGGSTRSNIPLPPHKSASSSMPAASMSTPVTSMPSASISTPVTSMPSASISTPVTSMPSASTSTAVARSRPRRRQHMKFVGRHISHEWIIGQSGQTEWYNGTVQDVVRGHDGNPDAVYTVLYAGDTQSYEVDHLHDDFSKGSVKFLDI